MEFIIFVMGCTMFFIGYLAGTSKNRRKIRKLKREIIRRVDESYDNGHKDGWIKGVKMMAQKYAPEHDVLHTP